jgi:tetratricopeptide (TPR) repeat protein
VRLLDGGHLAPADSPAALVDAATRWLEAARPDLALAAANRALEVDPDHARALGIVGLVAQLAGGYDLARSCFVRAIAGSPDDPVGHRRLAALFVEEGRLDEAVAALRSATAVAPRDEGSWLDLAEVLLRGGQATPAADAYRAAIALDPEGRRTDARLILTSLDLAAGRLDTAVATYRDLLRHDDQDPARHLLVAGPLRGLRDWCLAQGAPFHVVEAAHDTVVRRPHHLDDPAAPAPVPVSQPERHVAVVPDATVFGGSDVVLSPTGELLLDPGILAAAHRYDLAQGVLRHADHGIGFLDAEAVGSGTGSAGATGDDSTIEAGVLLAGPSSANYFHWLLEHLARLANLEAVEADMPWRHLPIIVDRAAIAVPQLRDALARIVGPELRVVELDPGCARRVRRLLVPSPTAWMPTNLRADLTLRAEDAIVSEAAIHFLRRSLSAGVDQPAPAGVSTGTPTAGRRLFLERPNAHRLQNAAELAAILAHRGFETVRPEHLPLDAQVELFANAGMIVAETGAALTNLLFAPAGARVLVLAAERWDTSLFPQIAGVLGLDMRYLIGAAESADQSQIARRHFSVDPAALDRVVAGWLQ